MINSLIKVVGLSKNEQVQLKMKIIVKQTYMVHLKGVHFLKLLKGFLI